MHGDILGEFDSPATPISKNPTGRIYNWECVTHQIELIELPVFSLKNRHLVSYWTTYTLLYVSLLRRGIWLTE